VIPSRALIEAPMPDQILRHMAPREDGAQDIATTVEVADTPGYGAANIYLLSTRHARPCRSGRAPCDALSDEARATTQRLAGALPENTTEIVPKPRIIPDGGRLR
jgi:hypothetical protein